MHMHFQGCEASLSLATKIKASLDQHNIKGAALKTGKEKQNSFGQNIFTREDKTF